MASSAMFESAIPDLELIARGKVRDMYAVDEHHILIVTTDRVSAYDVVLPDPIAGKGEVLTKISNFWFEMMADLIPNHLNDTTLESIVRDQHLLRELAPRSIVVKRLNPLPIEAVVRGYLIGSGWRDYLATGKVCGHSLPSKLQQAAPLVEPLFTPATKAAMGNHDENIDLSETEALIGADLTKQVKKVSIRIYERAAAYALKRGILIADTKFEFGLDEEGKLHIIDEILTPDSSRFWPASDYRTGFSPPSFDKQFLRDYLDTLDWDKTAPGPTLPAEILQQTGDKYREALRILTCEPSLSPGA